MRADERPRKKLHSMAQTDTHTDRHTDMATHRPTRPSGVGEKDNTYFVVHNKFYIGGLFKKFSLTLEIVEEKIYILY